MRYIELFAGIGGFRNGLERVDNVKRIEIAQQTDVTPVRISNHPALLVQERRQSAFTCVYANEWDKYAASIYRRHYGEIDTRDITTVDVRDIPDHDLLTAGFPCQDFSIAGKRAGLDGTRGTLFYEIARILKSKRPRHFLLENVKGLLSHKEGETFQTILGVLTDLGYSPVEWMVLNSKHFGVPQNRERVFIIGHLRGRCTGEVFPIRESHQGNTESSRKIEAESISGAITPKSHSPQYRFDNSTTLIELTEGQNQGQRTYDVDGLAKTLAGEAGGQGAKTGLYAMRGRNPDNPSDRRTGSPTEQRLELNEEGITNTLTSVAKDNLWLKNARIRRLTPIECERLQGFPDGWTEWGQLEKGIEIEISDSQRYKAMGNAVTTNVITAIGTPLVKHIKQ